MACYAVWSFKRPSTFMRLMNHMFREYIGKFVLVYFDDILIYSRTLDDHLKHLRLVLEYLRRESIYINRAKCSFVLDRTNFLGFIVTKDGITVDESKITAIRDWPTPTTPTQVRSFLGLTGFYKRFVRNFSTLAVPLHNLTKKETTVKWLDSHEAAFRELKEALCSAPVL